MKRLKNKSLLNENDLSVMERILAKESDSRLVYILALDLILVGIDTVSNNFMHLSKNFFLKSNQLVSIIN